MPEELVFFPRKSRLLLGLLVTGVLFGLSAVVMFSLEQIMHRDLRFTALIVAFLGCIIFGYGLMYSIIRLVQSQPLLKADKDGIWFNASLVNHGLIRWDEVEGYELVKYGLSQRVLIKLREPWDFLEKFSGLRKWAFRLALKRYGTPVALPEAMFGEDAVQVLKKVSEWGRRL